jgi:NifU-like protein involved in Fe-S cluster formation
MNKIYSSEEKRKILLNNYSQPNKQVDFEELKKISFDWKTPFLTVRSLDEGCGDVLYLLIIKQGNYLQKCLFSGQQSCLITTATTNILFSCLEKKDLKIAQELIDNCQKMIEKKDYNLNNCPDFQVFSDISQFPHRIECVKLVIRGIRKLL